MRAKLDLILKSVWVIIPAYNEADVIGPVLARVLTVCPNVILIDDGSSDRTVECARAYPVHVLKHPINVGQGAALETGFRYALAQDAQILVTFDADGQMDDRDIATIIQPIVDGTVDVTLGSRFLSDKPLGMPLMRRTFLTLATIFTRWTTGLSVSDTHNGFRAFSRRAAQALKLRQDRMAHASEILHLIQVNKWSYQEVPVAIRYSSYSLKKGQRTSDILNILWDLMFKIR